MGNVRQDGGFVERVQIVHVLDAVMVVKVGLGAARRAGDAGGVGSAGAGQQAPCCFRILLASAATAAATAVQSGVRPAACYAARIYRVALRGVVKERGGSKGRECDSSLTRQHLIPSPSIYTRLHRRPCRRPGPCSSFQTHSHTYLAALVLHDDFVSLHRHERRLQIAFVRVREPERVAFAAVRPVPMVVHGWAAGTACV